MLTCTLEIVQAVQAVKQPIKLSWIWDTLMLAWCYYNEFRMYNLFIRGWDLNEILGK